MGRSKNIFDSNVFYEKYNKTDMSNIENIRWYIKSCGGVLPQDVTDFLFQMYEKDKQNGVDIANSVPRTILIIANEAVPLYTLTKRLNIFSSDDKFEEYLMSGKIGLIKAIDKFNPSMGNTFLTFANTVITNEIFMYKRHIKQAIPTISSDDVVYTDEDGNELLIKDTFEDPDENFYQINNLEIMKERLQIALKFLSPKEQMVLSLRFGLNGIKPCNQREISKILELSQGSISKIHTSACRKLRKILDESATLGFATIEKLYKQYPLLTKEDIEKTLEKYYSSNPEIQANQNQKQPE